MNAIAYHPTVGLADPFDGVGDLRHRVIRCVGLPDERFQEDALRILRALRFASSFGFSIDGPTKESIHRNRLLLESISAERVQSELMKLLTGREVGQVLREYADVLSVRIPEYARFSDRENWENTVRTVEAVPAVYALRLTMFLHDIADDSHQKNATESDDHARLGAAIAERILKRLKADNETKRTVQELILLHDTIIQPDRVAVKKWLNRIGEKRLRQLITVQRADVTGYAPADQDEQMTRLTQTQHCVDTVCRQKQCVSLKQLAVNGDDLIALTGAKGDCIGKTLNTLLELVIEEKIPNDRRLLLDHACLFVNEFTDNKMQRDS